MGFWQMFYYKQEDMKKRPWLYESDYERNKIKHHEDNILFLKITLAVIEIIAIIIMFTHL